MEIPWHLYSEPEIHEILAYVHESQGYSVRNIHKEDRSHEEGADLILSKRGETEETAVAVKMKPLDVDIGQLKKLSGRQETLKRYVYLQTPSVSFQKAMKTTPNVQFWEPQKLTQELLSGNGRFTTWLILDWTPFSLTLFKIRQLLARVFLESKNRTGGFPAVASPHEALTRLWPLKDRAASLHKTFKYLRELLSRLTSRPEYEDFNLQRQLLDVFLLTIDKIKTDSLDGLNQTLLELQASSSELLSYVANKTSGKSSWRWILEFVISLTPSSVSAFLEVNEKKRLTWVETLEKYQLSTKLYQKETYRQGDIVSGLIGYVDLVKQACEGIETFIDDLFDCLSRELAP